MRISDWSSDVFSSDLAEFDGDVRLLGHRQPQPAISLGDRQPEQPEPAHLRDDRLGHRILPLDLRPERPQPLGDETPHGLDQRFEGYGGQRHVTIRHHPGFVTAHHTPPAPSTTSLGTLSPDTTT